MGWEDGEYGPSVNRSLNIVFWPWFTGKQRNCNLATVEIPLLSIVTKPVEKVQPFTLFPGRCPLGYNSRLRLNSSD